MDLDETISRFVDDATTGLKDDAELRLDVRAELRSHLEESIAAHEAEGKTRGESLELAQKAFGPVAEVASDLVEANKRRMKLRALTRLALRGILVPASVVMAIVVCSRLVSLHAALGLTGVFSESGLIRGKRSLDRSLDSLSEGQRFLWHGDRTRPSKAEQQRAIWEADPENKVYYGNYICHLISEYRGKDGKRSLDFVADELGRGKAIDPDNARFNVLLAGIWLDSACELKWIRGKDSGDREAGPCVLVVKDRELLDRAMREVVEVARKPVYRTYSQEMLEERFRLLPPIRSFEDRMARITWSGSSVLLPDLGILQKVAGTAACYGELLATEGRSEDVGRFLDMWHPLAVNYGQNAFTLIELLICRSIIEIGRRYARSYQKLGQPDRAREAEKKAERLLMPFERYLDWSRVPPEFEMGLERSASLLDQMVLPALGSKVVPEIDFGPGRRLEHLLAEQTAVSFYLVVLIGVMLVSLVAALRWQWAKGMEAGPLLLLPRWPTMLRMLACGVLLPLGLFCLYTRWSGFACREYGLGCLLPRFVLELLLLGLTMFLLSRSLATRVIRTRCESLRIPVPPLEPWRGRVVSVTMVLLWVGCFVVRGENRSGRALFVVGILCSLAALLTIWFVAGAVVWGIGRKGYGLYYGSLARSLIPVFAGAILLIGGLAHPYLRRGELRLLHTECSLWSPSDPAGFTHAENLLVERIRAGLLRAAKELEEWPDRAEEAPSGRENMAAPEKAARQTKGAARPWCASDGLRL